MLNCFSGPMTNVFCACAFLNTVSIVSVVVSCASSNEPFHNLIVFALTGGNGVKNAPKRTYIPNVRIINTH